MTKSKLYLPVIGRLNEKMQLSVWPFFHIPSPKKLIEIKDSKLSVILFDQNGNILHKSYLAYFSFCGGENKAKSNIKMVRGLIPWFEEMDRIEYRWENKEIYKIKRSSISPEIELISKCEGILKGKQEIKWQAKHQDNQPLQFVIRYSNDGGKNFERLEDRTNKNSITIDFDDVIGGENCILQVIGTDGINNTIATSDIFQVPLKKCATYILSPLDNSKIVDSQSILLNGQAHFRDEREDEYENLNWYSSKDGFLGNGELLQVKLSPGDHILRLEAGKGERQGMDMVNISVDA